MPASDARTALIETALADLARVSPSFGARAVARKAGVNHGLIPYYFKDAEGLLLASIEEATAKYLEAFAELMNGRSDPVERQGPALVDTMIDWALTVIRTDPAHFARKRNICSLAADNQNVARYAQKLVASEVAMTSNFIASVRGRKVCTQSDETTAHLLIALFDGIAAQAAIGVAVDTAAVTATVWQMLVLPEGG
ncbi:hypothetical protein KUV51_06125 [Tateyamaria omphalii]|uniref:TetR/AcrR family transcriptional regulator n=1 Tax=Tateyamaria omphalii TaxID=299262 RepID=UPI001C99B08D|nr:TetR/AcrR family transcriptional regulator [Tateyamaria omphalii]MBY5932570.1 hypothetical protein [Tateyamaria omphalii]